MKFYKCIIAVFFLSLFFIRDSGAQVIKSFSSDSIKFVQEMSGFFIDARQKEGGEYMKKKFIPIFYSGKFSEKEKQVIYSTCNIMLKKRMKPFPDFKNYLSTMMNFVSSKQTEESFDAWQESLEKIIENSTSKVFADFLTTSELLFSENILYKSSTVTWSSDDNRYVFEYDSLPVIIFSAINLKCDSKGDSTVIYNTSGIYYPTEGKWIGKGGKVNWIRTGFDDNTVYAELKEYKIELKTTSYRADSVIFYNTIYFDKPLLGKLEEKVLPNITEKNASYPKFESYNKRFQIKNIVEGVDYDGGFSMIGPKFVGAGSTEENANLIFYRNKAPFLIASSKVFIIRKDGITSEKAAIKIYLDKDSIVHPGLQMKLITEDKELTLFRDGKGISQSPYFNTFHNIDMDFEALYWKIDEPVMNMQVIKGSAQTSAHFESANYFSTGLYQKMLGMDNTHPLVLIKEVTKGFNSRELQADDIARYMRFTMEQVAPMLLDLSNLGFVSYNTENQKVYVKDKLFEYLEANAQKRDYDVIEFNSDIAGKPNATLNLLNFDLTMRGVSKIFLSDSQNVYIRPLQEIITLKKNRDFIFGGSVHAGLFDYYGKEFSFEYETFKINLIKVDSLSIRVKAGERDIYGNQNLVRVKTVIEDIQGDLLIDGPNNKSGTKDLSHYPIFNSRKESYVYYDRTSIQDGAYSRDKFYFKLEPFTIDSLNNFGNDALAFKGRFVSAGIFPDFDENLTLQPDFSLGFVRKTPPGGYQVYGNKALFENDIKMSHEGLRGDGTLKYLTSTTWSDDFIFYPDSINALAQKYNLEEQMGKVEYPAVFAESAYIHYMPYKDVMEVHKRDKPLVMYNTQAESHGKLYLRPGGLTGSGLMTFAKAEMEANLYKYGQNEFFSDTAAFRLSSITSSEIALKTDKVNAHVDFTNRKAKFVSNGGSSKLEFPSNQYICFMDQFTWFMDRENDGIEVSGSGKANFSDPTNSGLDLNGSQFISINPQQDSLTFFSPAAKYDLKENIIYAKGVKYFNVADAIIYPDSGNIVIEKKAKMRTLSNSRILTNYVTRYHNIYNSIVNVFGKRSYTGSGYYDYVDETNTKQKIHFNNIAADSTAQTYAEGEIQDTEKFTLSPNFEYKGKVKLQANNQFLTFDGTCRIQQSCETLPKNWFKFKAEIDPEAIYIPLSSSELIDENNGKLGAGMMISSDSTGIYSTFLSKKQKATDENVLTAEGFLFFDKATREYRLSNMERLSEVSLPGNYISLNTNDCIFYGEGKLNFGANLGQVKMNPVGNTIHSLIDNMATFDLIIPVDFFFDESAMEKMATQMQKSSSAEATNYSRPTFEKGLRELLGKEEADKLISQLNLYGSYRKFPSELIHTIMFTDVKFLWDTESNSYQSKGKIGIGNIYKNQVNKMVNGNIQIIKKRSGDILNIYLELDGGIWYYFNYQRNIMQAISSNEEFNTILKELKSDKRKYDHQKGEAAYQFMISTVKKKNDFLKKIDSPEE